MAAKDQGAAVDCLEKRISDLERRIFTSEKDVLSLKGSSVTTVIFIDGVIAHNLVTKID